MSVKRYTSSIVAIDAFGDGIIPLPDELMKEMDWRVHDELNLEMKDGAVIITNLSKQKRDKKP